MCNIETEFDLSAEANLKFYLAFLCYALLQSAVIV